MIKKLSILIVFILLFPMMVSAKEYCSVVSGDGKTLGDEINCGGEHFYVLSSTEDEVRLLAKYNLYTGVNIYQVKIEKEAGDTRSDAAYCQDIATEHHGTVKNDGYYNQEGYCFYSINNVTKTYNEVPLEGTPDNSVDMNEVCEEQLKDVKNAYFIRYNTYSQKCVYDSLDKEIIQNEEAIGAHVDEEGNYLYPQIGDVYTPYSYSHMHHFDYHFDSDRERIPVYTIQNTPIKEGTSFYDYYFKDYKTILQKSMGSGNDYPSTGIVYNSFIYKKNLEQRGFDIKSISLLPLSELNNIVKDISNQELPLLEWTTNYESLYVENRLGTILNFGDIKSYIPKKYSWLYSTTYWNSSYFYQEVGNMGGAAFIFTASMGKICASSFGLCKPSTVLGCGIRPVVVMNRNQIAYNIHTKQTGDGTIRVKETASDGEPVTFEVLTNNDSEIESVIITTDDGTTIEFTEGEITHNDDGTITINTNNFTMPATDVTIEVKWIKKPEEPVIEEPNQEINEEIINPQTDDKLPLYITILLFSICGLFVIYKHR